MIHAVRRVIAIDIAVAIAIGSDRTGNRARPDGRRNGNGRFILGAGAQREQPGGSQSHMVDFHIFSLGAMAGIAGRRIDL